MIKKILNPIYVGAFVFALLLGSVGHLMYGSCQTTKYHYMCQAYWMPDYLPDPMIRHNYGGSEYFGKLEPYNNYTGTWRTWTSSGSFELMMELNNGLRHGIYIFYDESGYEGCELNFKLDKLDGKQVFYRSDRKQRFTGSFEDGIPEGLWRENVTNGINVTIDIYEQRAVSGQTFEIFLSKSLELHDIYNQEDFFNIIWMKMNSKP